MITTFVMRALAPVEVPVAYMTYTGPEDAYVTFFSYLEQPEGFADDKERVVGQYVQVDVWAKGDYTELVNKTHRFMQEAGFRRKSFADLYEDALKIHHKSMKYVLEREG